MNAYILLGGEDDLFMLEITDTGAHHLGGKQIVHIEGAKVKDTVVYLGGGPCMCTWFTWTKQGVLCAWTNEFFEIFDDEHNVTGVMEPFHHPGAMEWYSHHYYDSVTVLFGWYLLRLVHHVCCSQPCHHAPLCQLICYWPQFLTSLCLLLISFHSTGSSCLHSMVHAHTCSLFML